MSISKSFTACLVLCFMLLAKTSAQQPTHGLLFDRLSLSRESVCQPGKTVKLSAVVTNSLSMAFDGVLVVKIAGLADQQFERETQFPAKDEHRIEICIPVPPNWKDQAYIEFEATLFSRSEAGEQMLDIDGVPLRQTLKVPVDSDPMVVSTGFSPLPFLLPWWYWPEQPPDMAYESIIASKTAVGASRLTIGQRNRPLPSHQAQWQALDVLVLNDPHILKSAHHLDSISRFIDGGGTVWAMLDKVPMTMLEPLLSSGNSVEVLDSVQLNHFTVDVRDGAPEVVGLADRTLNLETPATLVRVVESGGEVKCLIDRWPVIICFQQGAGRLILTTLEMNAWIERRTNRIMEPTKETDFTPRLWCTNLCRNIISPASAVIHPRGTLGLDQPEFGPTFAHSLIGNPVVPRRTVAILLVCFLLALSSIATWCWWRGAWRQAAVLTPSVAGLFAVGAVALALNTRQGVPEMSASLSISRTSFSGNSAVVRQQGAMHLLNQRNLTLQGASNGSAWADSDTVTSGVKRIRFSSLDRWGLTNQSWPPGVWGYQAEYVQPLEAVLAEAAFTSQGLKIRLPAQLSALTDCVFSFQPGQLKLGKPLDNNWLVDGTLSAQTGRWTTSAVLDDEQLRRQKVLDEIFKADSGASQTQGWTNRLLGWRPDSGSTSWNGEITSVGSTLEVLPIRLLKPSLQEEVLVPAGSLAINFDQRGVSRSPIFREESGSWEANASQPTKIALRFSLPNCLIPFQANAITLSLDITAPRRSVRIWSNRSQPPQLLANLESPSIPWSETFMPDQLSLDDDGAFYLLLEVSDRIDQDPDSIQTSVLNWHVNRFEASCLGHRRSLLP